MPESRASTASIWHRTGISVALALALMSLGDFLGDAFRSPASRHMALSAAVAVAAAGLAIAALAPSEGTSSERRRRRRTWRGAGIALAGLTLGLGAAHWVGLLARLGFGHVSGVTAFCFLVMGGSLLAKPRFPRTAVSGDMVVAFVGLAVTLDYLLGAPNVARHAVPMRLPTGIALFLLAGAWMAVWPTRRPVSFFVEQGSAGAVLRRILPITLLYPVLLVTLAALRGHAHPLAARVVQSVIVYGTVVFGIAVFWIIAYTLDRRDQAAAAWEQKVLASEERVRTLLESTNEGIYAVDLDGRCNWCNPATARILGADSTEALLGQPIHELIHHTRADGSPYPAEECVMMQAARRSEAYSAEEELVWRLDGSSFPCDFKSSPLLREGRLAGAVVTFSDVTERSQLRAQFHQAQKMEAIGRLAAGVAHDFNNLLTVINGYTEMLLMEQEPTQSRSKVTSIRRAGERAAGLTKQLLAFSRQQVLEMRTMNLNTVLAEMDPLLRRVIGEDVTFTTSPDPNTGLVRADAGQVSQILMNLVVNARDAMPEGGHITVETANVHLDAHYAAQHPGVLVGDYVMLAVTDTGSGMDAATQQHIFEPFFTTKPTGQGTGLGLATVFGIVKQSGGSIGVYSEVGRGTSMKVYLPRLAHAGDEETEELKPRLLSIGRETLLLVEDEETVRALMAEVLGSAGYKVIVADDPLRATELAREYNGKIDLLVSDLVMPEMDGRRLLRNLLAFRPALAVLFISGYPDNAIEKHGEIDPGTAFLQKPFTPEALVRKVRAVLDAGVGRRAAAGG